MTTSNTGVGTPPNARVGKPTKIRYEILDCALAGHHLIGRDVRTVRPEDAPVLREYDGLRWHRCLRCDAWVALALPSDPPLETLPDREDIELPMRGKALRDRYVLRLIAIDRVIHVVLFLFVSIGIVLIAQHRSVLRRDFANVVTAIWGNTARTGGHGALRSVDELLALQKGSLYAVAALVFAYAVLEGTEAVGLWLAKRWAEYLTFVATIVLLPLEIYELTRTISWLKIVTLAINLLIAVYLLVSKRLFGLRGGGRVDEEERAFDSGWPAIDRATPPAPAGTSPALPRDPG